MGRIQYIVYAFFSIIICCEPLYAMDINSIEYYKKEYGELAAADHPLAARAYEIFARVAAAADKPSDRYPKLLIVPTNSDPWARCLQDGGIVISQTALEFCYRGVSESVGAARVAFVLGHEVAHLTKGDFWHADVSEFMSRYASKAKGLEAFEKLVKDPEAIMTRELQADYQGMLYAFMAGYDPRVIVRKNDIDFFSAWTSQISGQKGYAVLSHPSPELRAKHLLTLLESIDSQISIFELGLRLYQKGDYDNALVCLTHIQRRFPSREVLNDIGLIHFQKALDYLSGIDKAKARRFKLATILDAEFRAASRGRDQHGSGKAFKKETEAAIISFRDACRRDHHYVPGRVNLSSALILKGDYSGAMAVLDEVGRMGKHKPDVLNNNAVALYLFGRSKKIDTARQAISMLEDVHVESPDCPAVLYNLGAILLEQHRDQEVAQHWRDYLKYEPKGCFAERAWQFLGTPSDETNIGKPTTYKAPPPFSPGPVDEDTLVKLKTYTALALETINLDGIYYTNADVRVLVSRRCIRFVESAEPENTKLAQILSRYGRPKRIIAAASGLSTYIYDRFALDIRKDRVIKVVYFQ